jgi:hypothetical protein
MSGLRRSWHLLPADGCTHHASHLPPTAPTPECARLKTKPPRGCKNRSILKKVKKPKTVRLEVPCNNGTSSSYTLKLKATASSGGDLIQGWLAFPTDPTCAHKRCSESEKN